MLRLLILVLLSSAVLICSAAPALEPVTCNEDNKTTAAHLATNHINEHHHHGYKFQLNEIQGIKLEKEDDGCSVQMQLDLLETKCHIVNPKEYEDCELREDHARAVMANCTVMMTVKTGDAKVIKYNCDTQQVKSNMEMARMCPDCPTLMPLNSPEGLTSVNEAVKQFNQNTTNQHYYVLQEVGRISSAYIMTTGMNYYAEFVLVETHCPMGSRIIPEACKPLCHDRAHHAFCHSSYSRTNGLGSVGCEFYPPLNTTALGPGEREPICRHHHHRGPPHHGPPPHAHGHPPHAGNEGSLPHAHGKGHHSHADGEGSCLKVHGKGHHSHADDEGSCPHAHGKHRPNANGQVPPPPAGGQGPPPHAGGHKPPPGQDRPHPHYHHFHPCHGLLTNIDPALHPICPWPHTEPHPNPKPNQS
ncbi:alpha-2-HS-glycoprotein 1 [Mastacembelus armatus]|uniref:Alpha-2-HS-glycoprotein 1 n=1 Tax=Mastacembelus armatus TaxID=205130 RepID=A0A7N8XAF0_9TELE|nr:histidine-rich glycoprotein-like [Mastacembelus armatus]